MCALSIDELSARDAFPHPVERLQVRETHISRVVLTGSFAYKIKKPVKLDFIDASTLERRRHYCEEELRLNRRLAPELYVDVVPISRIDGCVRVGDASSVVEYAVRMKQFDGSDELPSLLDRGAISLDEVTALGELLGQFHLDTPASSQVGFRERTQRMYDAVLSNLEQLTSHSAIPGIARLSQWTQETADALEPSMSERERSGYVRECHGDLHSANIVRVGRRLVPFDCIDFDPDLRWIDVMSDMRSDLERNAWPARIRIPAAVPGSTAQQSTIVRTRICANARRAACRRVFTPSWMPHSSMRPTENCCVDLQLDWECDRSSYRARQIRQRSLTACNSANVKAATPRMPTRQFWQLSCRSCSP